MRPFDKAKALRTFEKLSVQEIRQRKFMQFNDDELLDIAGELYSVDQEKYVAILEVILHSIDHSYELIEYGELYMEVINLIVPFRTNRDNVALAYAWFAYAARHGYRLDIILAWRSVIFEFLTDETVDGVTAGLEALSRYLRTLIVDANDVSDLLHSLFWQKCTLDVGEKLVRRIIAAAEVRGDFIVEDFWREALEVYLEDVEEENDGKDLIQVNEALLDFIAAEVAALPLDIDEETSFVFKLQYPVARLFDDIEDEEAWLEEIIPRAPWLLPELIYLALWPKIEDTDAADRAVDALRRLWQHQAAPMDELAPWLQKAQGDWRAYLSDEICKVGFLTPEELKQVAADTSVEIALRIGAIEVLLEIVERKPELRSEMEPFFRHLLTRPESREIYEEEEFLGGFITTLLDYPEWIILAPEIEIAFVDDVVDPEAVSPEDVEQAWQISLNAPRLGSPPEGMEYLPLRCKQCGSTRFHAVKNILIDLGTMDKSIKGKPVKYSPFIMDTEIVCPRCGARDAYEVSQLFQMKLMAQAFPDVEMPEAEGEATFSFFSILQDIDSPLQISKARMADSEGVEIHPLELRDRYLQLIKQNPRNASYYVRLANVYKNIGRDVDALEVMRRVRKVTPDDLEVLLLAAMAEHDAGDKEVAKELYSRIIDDVIRTGGFRPSREEIEISGTARDGLNRLRKGKVSPWAEGARASIPRPKPKRRFGIPRRKKKKKRKRR